MTHNEAKNEMHLRHERSRLLNLEAAGEMQPAQRQRLNVITDAIQILEGKQPTSDAYQPKPK